MHYLELRNGVLDVIAPYKRANTSQTMVFKTLYPGLNSTTPDIWALLSLNNGKYIVEVSSGHVVDRYVFGITILIRDKNNSYSKPPTSARCIWSVNDLRKYLEELHTEYVRT